MYGVVGRGPASAAIAKSGVTLVHRSPCLGYHPRRGLCRQPVPPRQEDVREEFDSYGWAGAYQALIQRLQPCTSGGEGPD